MWRYSGCRVWKRNHLLRMRELWGLSAQKIMHKSKGQPQDKPVKEVHRTKKKIPWQHHFSHGNTASHQQKHTVRGSFWRHQGKLQIQAVFAQRKKEGFDRNHAACHCLQHQQISQQNYEQSNRFSTSRQIFGLKSFQTEYFFSKGGIPFAFCTLWGSFFLLFCIFGHKIGAVINSIGIIVLIQLQIMPLWKISFLFFPASL